MHIYKFRMRSEENDNFVRDIEIQASQTFGDFHDMISECVNLNGNELASFHICDQKWNKLIEITLIEMISEAGEEDESTKHIEETYVMHNARIRDFINEPSQRLVYEYDFLNMKTFYIELLSVFKQKDEAKYPRCTNKRGEITETVAAVELLDDEELRSQLLEDFENLLDDTLDSPPEHL